MPRGVRDITAEVKVWPAWIVTCVTPDDGAVIEQVIIRARGPKSACRAYFAWLVREEIVERDSLEQLSATAVPARVLNGYPLSLNPL